MRRHGARPNHCYYVAASSVEQGVRPPWAEAHPLSGAPDPRRDTQSITARGKQRQTSTARDGTALVGERGFFPPPQERPPSTTPEAGGKTNARGRRGPPRPGPRAEGAGTAFFNHPAGPHHRNKCSHLLTWPGAQVEGREVPLVPLVSVAGATLCPARVPTKRGEAPLLVFQPILEPVGYQIV